MSDLWTQWTEISFSLYHKFNIRPLQKPLKIGIMKKKVLFFLLLPLNFSVRDMSIEISRDWKHILPNMNFSCRRVSNTIGKLSAGAPVPCCEQLVTSFLRLNDLLIEELPQSYLCAKRLELSFYPGVTLNAAMELQPRITCTADSCCLDENETSHLSSFPQKIPPRRDKVWSGFNFNRK